MPNDKKNAILKDVIVSVIVACAIMFLLNGCSVGSARSSDSPVSENLSEAVQQQKAPARNHDRFYTIDPGIDTSWVIDEARIIVDDETGVEYLYIWNNNGYAGGSAMTMLMTSDGTPKINAAWALAHQDDTGGHDENEPSDERSSE